MADEPSTERLITKSRGVDIFLGILVGLLVTLAALIAFGISQETLGLTGDLPAVTVAAALILLTAALPVLFRWTRGFFTIGYCVVLLVQYPLLGWLVWRLCRERDAWVGILSIFALFGGSRDAASAARDATPGWVLASPLFIALFIAFGICLWTAIRMRTNRG